MSGLLLVSAFSPLETRENLGVKPEVKKRTAAIDFNPRESLFCLGIKSS
jgi:hypothetical protein